MVDERENKYQGTLLTPKSSECFGMLLRCRKSARGNIINVFKNVGTFLENEQKEFWFGSHVEKIFEEKNDDPDI
uniref:Uncharacterized protein n=1 Tax=Romanomermis culicivorax TaxID=13658 RepID=A0A915IRR9_ROMCU